MRDQLKAGLSASGYDSGNENGPSVSDLAEKIKSLKAAHSVEATPQRIRQKHSTAEEPITARIRRRQSDASNAIDQTAGHDAAQESSGNAPATFRERIVAERLQRTDGQSPS